MIRQIRIGILYLLFPIPFAAAAPDKNKFFINFIKSLNYYFKLLTKVNEMFESAPGLTTIQKINSAYMISTAVLSVTTSMKQIKSLTPGDTILNGQIKILSSIYLKKNVSAGKTGIGNIDDKLFAEFVTWLQTGDGGAGNFVGNAGFIYNNTKISDEITFMTTLQQNGLPIPRDVSNIYYINNAVNAGVGQPPFFCPFSSIMDGQPTCSSLASALKKDGVEYGTMDVIIRDGNIIGKGTPTTGETMRYHIRVEPDSNFVVTKQVFISAFLKIGDQVLISIGSTASTSSTPRAQPPLVVNLNAKSSPLEASACLKEIINVNIETMIMSGNLVKKWDDYLTEIQGTDKASIDLRRRIISASFRKSLGDFLQELNAVVDNGGYVAGPTYSNAPGTGKTILHPTQIRLGLSNDRPSGIRFMLLTLFGQTDINTSSGAGFINGDGKYLIAIRNKKVQGKGGRLITKKTKQTKRNKHKNQTNRKKLIKNKKYTRRKK